MGVGEVGHSVVGQEEQEELEKQESGIDHCFHYWNFADAIYLRAHYSVQLEVPRKVDGWKVLTNAG